jgi:hypothetical protein
MADPRNAVSFNGIGQLPVTFIADGVTIVYDATKTGGADATMIGKAVTMSADGTVALAVDGDTVIGKLEKVEPDGKCHVVIAGFVTLPAGASATLTRGKKIVGALGAASAKGYVREVATATAAELGKARGFTVDNSDTTAVVVYL